MNWKRIALAADQFALPFWVVLIIYGAYEITNGIQLGIIPLVIGGAAFLIDATFVFENQSSGKLQKVAKK